MTCIAAMEESNWIDWLSVVIDVWINIADDDLLVYDDFAPFQQFPWTQVDVKTTL